MATNIDWGCKKILGAFPQRTVMEALLRDEKNIRYGWRLRKMKVSSSDRRERLLLLLALAYVLVVLIALICRAELSGKHWAFAV